MALQDGDYINMEAKLVATLLADTGAGGLREDLGGGTYTVNLVEAELKSEPRLYRDHELPTIAVSTTSKSEVATGKSTDKKFDVAFFIYTRSLDMEEAVSEVKKIAARLEKVIRDESAKPDGFEGLADPAVIDGAVGAVTASISSTNFMQGKIKDQQAYGAIGTIETEFTIPCDV